MSKKRLLISTIIIFIFIYVFNFIWHGILLNELYIETSALWRTEDEMSKLFAWGILYQFLMALIITLLFVIRHHHSNFFKDLKFGVLIGILMGLLQMSAYLYLPIGFDLAFLWFTGYFLMGIGIGLILALVYRNHKTHNIS